MNRKQQLEELFEAALPLEAAARTALLEQACSADVELRAEISALLEAHAAAQGFFAKPAIAEAAELLAADGVDALLDLEHMDRVRMVRAVSAMNARAWEAVRDSA